MVTKVERDVSAEPVEAVDKGPGQQVNAVRPSVVTEGPDHLQPVTRGRALHWLERREVTASVRSVDEMPTCRLAHGGDTHTAETRVVLVDHLIVVGRGHHIEPDA